jgi:hypothetical protein
LQTLPPGPSWEWFLATRRNKSLSSDPEQLLPADTWQYPEAISNGNRGEAGLPTKTVRAPEPLVFQVRVSLKVMKSLFAASPVEVELGKV